MKPLLVGFDIAGKYAADTDFIVCPPPHTSRTIWLQSCSYVLYTLLKTVSILCAIRKKINDLTLQKYEKNMAHPLIRRKNDLTSSFVCAPFSLKTIKNFNIWTKFKNCGSTTSLGSVFTVYLMYVIMKMTNTNTQRKELRNFYRKSLPLTTKITLFLLMTFQDQSLDVVVTFVYLDGVHAATCVFVKSRKKDLASVHFYINFKNVIGINQYLPGFDVCNLDKLTHKHTVLNLFDGAKVAKYQRPLLVSIKIYLTISVLAGALFFNMLIINYLIKSLWKREIK